MPPAADPHEAGLIGDGAGERAAAMAEQLAVGQIPAGRRAVVGQEHRGAAVRADVDGAGDELLAGSALAGDEHRQVVALQPLNLLDDARHRGARRQEAGQQRLERPVGGRADGAGRSVARGAQREALTRDGRDHPEPPHRPDGRSAAARRRARSADPSASRPSGSTTSALAAVRAGRARRDSRQRPRRVGVAPGVAMHADVAAGQLRRRRPRRRRATASSSAAAVSRPSRSGSAAASTIRRTIASSASAGEMTSSPVPAFVSSVARGAGVGEIALGAELLEDVERLVEMALGDRPRAGLGDEPSEREMAERRLIALAEQIEQRRALREVVIRVGGGAVLRVQRAAQPQVLAPGRRRASAGRARRRRWPAAARLRPGGPAAVSASAAIERRLQRVERRRAGRRDLVGPRDRLVERAAPQREPRAEHAHRPFVPLARLPAVGAVRVARAAEELAGDVVARRESGESARACRRRRRSSRETESGCAPSSARCSASSARVEIAEPHADLSERRQRDRQAVAGAVRLVQRRRSARRARAPARSGAPAS